VIKIKEKQKSLSLSLRDRSKLIKNYIQAICEPSYASRPTSISKIDNASPFERNSNKRNIISCQHTARTSRWCKKEGKETTITVLIFAEGGATPRRVPGDLGDVGSSSVAVGVEG
jgi:hypothetical protein